MVVGEVATSTHVLVIGGGPGGYAAALRCAANGDEVTLVERDAIGGTCLNIGCIPSKVLIHAGELAHLPTDTAGTGIAVRTTVLLNELQDHMRTVVGELTSGVGQLLANAGVTVISGTARFSKADRVAVETADGVRHIEFRNAIIATGSRPVELSNLPFSEERIVDSTGALFGFPDVPLHLAVVGGGYIGVELGTAWAKLGATVSIIEAQSSLLPELDSRLGRVVSRRLADLGVEVRTNTTAQSYATGELIVSSKGVDETVTADQVIVAVGRTPNTDDLGLDAAGIDVDARGLIPVDRARRARRNIYAIGDITDGPALAHKATAEAEVAARAIAGEHADFDPAAIPAVVFSDPEVATIGMTTKEAKAAGIAAERFVFPLSASARAKTLGADAGHVELVTDEAGTIIGAHMAGPNVSELAGEMAFAIEMAATAEEIAATIHPHPTVSESLLEAAHGVLGMPLHVAALKRS